jgi:hypothetical protein
MLLEEYFNDVHAAFFLEGKARQGNVCGACMTGAPFGGRGSAGYYDAAIVTPQ